MFFPRLHPRLIALLLLLSTHARQAHLFFKKFYLCCFKYYTCTVFIPHWTLLLWFQLLPLYWLFLNLYFWPHLPSVLILNVILKLIMIRDRRIATDILFLALLPLSMFRGNCHVKCYFNVKIRSFITWRKKKNSM